MYDKITLDRIELMHPVLRKELREQYLEINKMLPKGVRLRFTHTFRTFEEQDELFKKRPKVTNAKGGESIHNYGLAFDIVLLFDRDGDGTFEAASYKWDEHWAKVVIYFKSKGYVWGGDWKKFRDLPHFEKTFGNDYKKLMSKSKIKDGKYTYPIL